MNRGEAVCWRSWACSSARASRTDCSTRAGWVCSRAAAAIHTAAPFLLLATSPVWQHVPLASLGVKLSRREISCFCTAIQSETLSFAWLYVYFYGLRIIWQLQALLRTTTCHDRHVPSSRADSDTCTSPTWSSVCLACRSKRCSCNALITLQGIFLTFVQTTLFQFQKTVSKPQWLSMCFLTSTLASQHSTEVLASRMFFSKAWWQRFFRKKK